MSFQALPEEEAAGRCLQELHQFPALFYLSALQLPTLLPEYTAGVVHGQLIFVTIQAEPSARFHN
jgi:hypothetical protein